MSSIFQQIHITILMQQSHITPIGPLKTYSQGLIWQFLHSIISRYLKILHKYVSIAKIRHRYVSIAKIRENHAFVNSESLMSIYIYRLILDDI